MQGALQVWLVIGLVVLIAASTALRVGLHWNWFWSLSPIWIAVILVVGFAGMIAWLVLKDMDIG